MALNLRKSITRNVVGSAAVCFIISIALSLVTGPSKFSIANLAWPFLLAAGIGLFSGWRTIAKIKKGVLNSVSRIHSYVRLERSDRFGGTAIDWSIFDDYAVQLETRGYSRLGEFTTYPVSRHFIGVAACFLDASASTIVEVQHIQMLNAKTPEAVKTGGVHFCIVSVIGGHMRVVTTDHTATASTYLIRGDSDVFGSFPGLTLLHLLEKHQRVIHVLQERTGKTLSTGLNMECYVFLVRERFAQAHRRVSAMNGYEIAEVIDAFEAKPKNNWSPSASLAALPETPLADIDTSPVAQGQPAIMESGLSIASASVVANDGTLAEIEVDTAVSAQESDEDAALRQQVENAANWLYWIAGLSVVNDLVGAAGSNWGFPLGLGVSQLLIDIAREYNGRADAVFAVVLWIASFAAAAFFAACGRFAHRPSIIAFAVGIVLFGLDTLIFLLASDWVGLALHAMALYYLWGGLSAARQLKKQLAAYGLNPQ